MEYILKAAALAMTVSLVGLAIKKGSPELNALLALSAALAVIYLASGMLGEAVDFIREVSELPGVSPVSLNIVLKTMGIAIITRFSADVCKDAGQSALSSGLETAGAAAALCTALPLFRSVLHAVGALI